MKCAGIILLFSLWAVAARAQVIDMALLAADSLSAQPEKALVILNMALADHPDSEELLKVRAEAYENLKQYDHAVADYMRLTQLVPDEENLWYYLGRNQYHSGQLQDALKSLHRATKLNPKYLPAFHSKIQVLLQQHQCDAALKVSDSTLNIGATAMSYFLLGEVYSRLKSWQKAEWAYQSVLKIDKGYMEAYIALANISADAGKARESLQSSDTALGIDPDSKDALIARSRGFALSKNYTEAIEDVSYVITIDPDNIHARYRRGTYYLNTNKAQEAIKDFEHVLKLQPEHWQAIAGRAEAYAMIGNKKTALEIFQNLWELADELPEKDAIKQSVNQHIFELNRENQAPTVTLTDPIPDDKDIQAPENIKSITIKGIITDESPIKSLTVNGQTVPVTAAGSDFEFVAAVNLENTREIRIEVSDVYDNTTEVVYRLNTTDKPDTHETENDTFN